MSVTETRCYLRLSTPWTGLGSDGIATLQTLATEAGTYAKDRHAMGRLLPRWRAALERAVLVALADVVLLFLGH